MESPAVQEGFGWAAIRKYLGISPLGNACVAMALIIGYYHGWLKRSHPGTLATFAYDVPLVLGLMVAWQSLLPRRPLFPDSRTAIALKFVFGICIAFLLIPSDVPWLIRVASLRGWTLAPLMFLVGYHVLKTPQQLRIIGWLIVVLSISVTLYGMRQDPSEILNANVEDEGFMKTISGSTYSREDGRAGFRVFSTFVGPGMFALAVAMGVIVAVAEVTEPQKKILWRLLWVGAILLCLNGIFISGTRSSVLTAIFGSAVIAWFRGRIMKFAPIVAALGVAAVVVSSFFKTLDVSRMAEAFSPERIYGRAYIVVAPAIDSLLDNPIGHGLGTSTHGVPVIFLHLISRYKARAIDGDLGHAAVDMGIIGMVAYSIMMIRATRDSFMWTKALKGTGAETIAIMCSAIIAVCLPAFVTGSPFLHVPIGSMVWYFVGGLNRIYDDRPSRVVVAPGKPSFGIRRSQPIIPPGVGEGATGLAVAAVPPLPAKTVSKPSKAKRFLFN